VAPRLFDEPGELDSPELLPGERSLGGLGGLLGLGAALEPALFQKDGRGTLRLDIVGPRALPEALVDEYAAAGQSAALTLHAELDEALLRAFAGR
jgi:hypothetical protein